MGVREKLSWWHCCCAVQASGLALALGQPSSRRCVWEMDRSTELPGRGQDRCMWPVVLLYSLAPERWDPEASFDSSRVHPRVVVGRGGKVSGVLAGFSEVK